MAENFTDKTFQFELVSPERVLASEQAHMVTIPGENGEFGVLADHIPLLSSIRPGVVAVYTTSGEVKKIFVGGGFADVKENVCSVLAEEAINVTDLNRSQLEETLKNLKEDVTFFKDDHTRVAHLREEIDMVHAKLAAIAA